MTLLMNKWANIVMDDDHMIVVLYYTHVYGWMILSPNLFVEIVRIFFF